MTSMVICEIIHKDSLEACLWTRLVDYLYECGLAFFRLVFHGAERVFLLINYITHTLHSVFLVHYVFTITINSFRSVFGIRFLKRNLTTVCCSDWELSCLGDSLTSRIIDNTKETHSCDYDFCFPLNIPLNLKNQVILHFFSAKNLHKWIKSSTFAAKNIIRMYISNQIYVKILL